MKKFFLHILICCLTVPLFSFDATEDASCPLPELGTIISGNGGQNGVISLGENCIGVMEFFVLMANLGDYSPNTVLCSPCQLPSGYEPMNLHVSVPLFNIDVYMPIDFIEFLYYEGGNPIYGGYTEVAFDASEFCDNAGDFFTIEWEARLLIDAGGSNPYAPYPVCEHSPPGDIFDCTIFEYPMDCPTNCPMPELTEHHGTETAVCEYACAQDYSDGEDPQIVETAFEISPNPFRDDLQISWSGGTERPKTIELFDVNGRVLKSWRNLEEKIAHTIHVATEDLPNGVYFTKVIFTDKSYETYRLIKQ